LELKELLDELRHGKLIHINQILVRGRRFLESASSGRLYTGGSCAFLVSSVQVTRAKHRSFQLLPHLFLEVGHLERSLIKLKRVLVMIVTLARLEHLKKEFTALAVEECYHLVTFRGLVSIFENVVHGRPALGSSLDIRSLVVLIFMD